MSFYTNQNTRRRRPGASQNRNRYSGSRGRSRTNSFVDVNRYIKPAKQAAQVEQYVPTHKFSDFDVAPVIHQNLTAKGFDTPSPIQDQAIPLGLSGQDVIGIANTGTGKTAAFGVPVLHKLIQDRMAKALIIAPTRELAQQIEVEFRSLAKGSGLSGAVLIGGTSMGNQIRDLKHDPRIVIGTPGRIEDHINRRTLDLSKFNIVVLDEVDRMLDMGFIGPMRNILSLMARPRQSFFFSATLDRNVAGLIQDFSTDAVRVSVKTEDTSSLVNQDVVRYASKEDKIQKLQDLLSEEVMVKAIVFDNTQRAVERLSRDLADKGFRADSIHGGKSQGQRQRALSRFKSNNIDILVATDVAARGIDVPDISHVVNFSVPDSHDDYIHRVGRAGRAGRTGFAYTFVA